MSTHTDAIPRRLVPFITAQGLKGNLSALPLPDLLIQLRRSVSTGILSVEREGTRKAVYFHNGRVVFATSNSPSDRLGETLLRLGKISVEEYEQSLQQISHGRRQGKVLIEMGAMAPQDLWEGVEAQVREIIFSLFEWPTGDFVFESTTLPQREKVTVSFDPLTLVLQGLRRIDPEGALKGRYPDPGLILECLKDLDLSGLEPYEKHILSLVDGQRSVAEVCRESEIGDGETQKTLYALFCAGFLRVRGRKLRPSGEAPDRDLSESALNAYNSMYAYIYRYLLREIGPEADATLQSAVTELHAAGGIMAACRVTKGGIIDPPPLLMALAEVPQAERSLQLTNTLNELLYAMLFAVRKSIGADHEANILKALRPDSLLIEV
ncbi:MAG: DUF4388 domain-containing protein [Vicinamibacteria bacterium]|nr:DUF4388 domain-containing protein [Vicinamibacteria bacterium]